MTPHHRCIRAGRNLSRDHLDILVATYVAEWDHTPKGAIRLAGQLRAVALACAADCYWREKAEAGFHEAINDLERMAGVMPLSTPSRTKPTTGPQAQGDEK